MKQKFTRLISLFGIAVSCLSMSAANAVLFEDFSKFTAGTEELPDTENIAVVAGDEEDGTIAAEFTAMPGWGGTDVYQAGGIAYIGTNPDSYFGGHINTPNLDLTGNGGVFTVRFKARSESAVAENKLRVFNRAVDDESATVDITPEWRSYEVTLRYGAESTMVQFVAVFKAAFFVDDIEIASEGLATPIANNSQDYDGLSFTASWQPVENATSYLLNVYSLNGAEREYLAGFKAKEVDATSALVTGLDGNKTYYYTVQAKNASATSPESEAVKVKLSSLPAPEVQPATNVTDNGFTANWSTVAKADGYRFYLYKEYEAKESGSYIVADTDFSNVTEGTLDEPVLTQYSSLDNYFGSIGWNGEFVLYASGHLGLDNSYYVASPQDFLPAWFATPALDYSVGGGKTTVEFSALAKGSDGKISICYATTDDYGYAVPIESSRQTISIPMGDAANYKVELSGGVANSHIMVSMTVDSENQVFFDDFKIAPQINKGETVTTKLVDQTIIGGSVASLNVAMAKPADGSRYAYQLYAFNMSEYPTVISPLSGLQYVDYSGAVAGIKDSASKAYAVGGRIIVENPGLLPVSIYNAAGVMVYASSAEESVSVGIPAAGFYIVKVGNITTKLLAR